MSADEGRKFWKNNIGLKLLALSFALFLWFFVVGEEKAEVNLNIPLEILNLPESMIISNEFPSTIDVRLYGSRSLIRDLATRRISREIDLSGAKPGEITLSIIPDSIPVPGGIQVTRIHPSHVTLVLEPLVRKEVTVKPELKGKLAPGYELKGIKMDPAKVVIAGTKKDLARVGRIPTEPVDISGLMESLETTVQLNVGKYRVRVIGSSRLNMSLSIEEQIVKEKLFMPVEPQGTSLCRIRPEEVQVSVLGPANLISETMREGKVRAVVNLEGLGPGKYTKEPQIQLPPQIKILKVEPRSVRVIISEK
ncbi:MAG: CdaR family protein [Pseudomonadota bacterium]